MRTLTRLRRVRSWMTVAMAVLAMMAMPSHASNFWLATVTGPVTLEVQRSNLLGPFDDHLLFTVTAAHPLSFSAFISTGFSRRSTVPDMEGELRRSDGTLLEAGDAETNYMPEGYPSRDITFARYNLLAGYYDLRIHGTGVSFFPDAPIWARYHGTLTFAPIPEPETWALMLVGLAGATWWRRMRLTGKTQRGIT